MNFHRKPDRLSIDRQYQQNLDRQLAAMTWISVALATALTALMVGIVFFFMK
jgi:hypothetical protein